MSSSCDLFLFIPSPFPRACLGGQIHAKHTEEAGRAEGTAPGADDAPCGRVTPGLIALLLFAFLPSGLSYQVLRATEVIWLWPRVIFCLWPSARLADTGEGSLISLETCCFYGFLEGPT